MSDHMEWKLKALTDIWTGDAQRGGDRLIPTGLLGSIRWWFEVLVRGLGGKACDPSEKGIRYPDKDGNHCVVCELFGCTGWGRKFRFMVLDSQSQVIQNRIRRDAVFVLRFIPLRPIREEEWCLLDLTLRLIAEYGAIGGKTVLKPSDEQSRENKSHHKDYGLIQYLSKPDGWSCEKSCERLKAYISESRWRTAFSDKDFSWSSLQNFWCVKGRYLARQGSAKSPFNQVIGRKQQKSQAQQLEGEQNKNNKVNRWLAGRQQESKKVFSFKHPQEGSRTFGFVRSGVVDFDEIKGRLSQVWPGFEPASEFKTGENILRELCSPVSATQGGNTP